MISITNNADIAEPTTQLLDEALDNSESEENGMTTDLSHLTDSDLFTDTFQTDTQSQENTAPGQSVLDSIKQSNIYLSTDNASNYVRAAELLGVCRIPCFAHTINLAVQKGLTPATI